ncbi:Fc.00g048460.m01.CDS01 [Cosmosporella sp. VM-42]
MDPLGAVYPSRPYGAEDDAPTFLYLIQNGLGDPEHPTYGSWGGRWSCTNIGGKHYSDALDTFYMTHAQGSGNEANNKLLILLGHPKDSSELEFQWFQYRESDCLVRSRLPEEYVLGLEGLGRNASTPNILEANETGFRRFVTGHHVRITVPDETQPYEYHLILQVTSRNYAELPIRRYLRVLLLASHDDINPDERCEAMEVPAPKQTDWAK